MSSSRHDLHLHEQLLLLALRDRKGTVDYRAGHYNLAMGGAILAELALEGHIRIDEGKRAWVEAAPGIARVRDEVMDEALDKVRGSKRRGAASWVQRFGALKRLRHRTAVGLCRRGILRARESQLLLIFSRKVYPTVDPEPERRVIEALREAVMGDEEVEPGLGVVLSLAHTTGSLRIHFDRKELRARKRRLKAISSGEAFRTSAQSAVAAQQAVRNAVAAAQAAVAATNAAVVAAVAASSASG